MVQLCALREFVSRSIDFHDISCQYFLERLSLILMCRETKGGYHDVTLVEPARRQVAQHGAHILVFKLRAQLLQYNVALLDAARLLFRTLYAEGLALAYHFQNLCFHFLIMSHRNHGNHWKAARWDFFVPLISRKSQKWESPAILYPLNPINPCSFLLLKICY